ncbi:MAG: ABC transporter permease [Gammaproteobacteria bacterium]|nr:ABC transporter permease [Gammaproteobacteria bacterium]
MSEISASKLQDNKPVLQLLGLSSRLLWRDWQGGELRLLFMALVLAVTSVTGIALFTDRLEKALLLESANMLAADRIVSGRGELPEEVLQEGQKRGLRTASTLSFTSMAFSDSDNLLVAAKAVSDDYPLRGDVIIAEEAFVRGTPVQSGPAPGEVWLESRALSALGIGVGDSVFVGESQLRVGKIIITEPDRAGGSMLDNAGPRLMLHLDDVEATGVVQLGSRVSWRYLFADNVLAKLDAFEDWFRSREEWRGRFYIRDVRDESQEVSDALDRAEGFLLLGSLFAVILAGVAIALTAKRYSERHYDYVAILKTLGCTSSQITLIYVTIQLILAMVAILAGWVLGWLVHQGILQLLQSLLAVELPGAGWQPYVVGALTAVICLLAFALPPLLALKETPPLRVLRRDMRQQRFSDRLPYVFGLSGTIFLIYWYSQNLLITGVLLSAVAAIGLFLSVVSFVVLKSTGSVGMKAGSAWKLAMTAARRRRHQNVLQVMVFSVTIMSLLILTLLRTDLIDEWQAQLPQGTPNHFMLNISRNQISGIENFFAENNIQRNAFYPLISARVNRINGDLPSRSGDMGDEEESGSLTENASLGGMDDGSAVKNAPATSGGVAENSTEAAGSVEEGTEVLGRLSRRQVTWAVDLPPDNVVTAGEWWNSETGSGYVSIEEEYADWLDLELGDRLEFEINQQIIFAEVSSLRSVRWDNMQPNFFIIFSPGTIDHLAGTYLSTTLMEREQKILLNDLIRLFPTMVVIEIDALIEQIQLIISQVTSAIELISVLVLVSGGLVLLSCVNATLDERFHENAILRTLGAGQKLILSSLIIEFACIGLIAGIIATIGAEVSLFYLQQEIFELDYSFHYWVWPLGPVLGMLLIGGLGLISTRGVVRISPLAVLRRTAS